MSTYLFTISRIFISPYFSLIMIVCSLLLYIIYRSEEDGKFPVERKIAKWGGLIYFAVSAMAFIFGWFVG